MSKDKFDRLMNQYSSEAENQRFEERRLRARAARRQKIKNSLIFLAVVALLVFVCSKNDEFRDVVAKFFPASESGPQSIEKLANDTVAQKPDDNTTPSDPDAATPKFKAALQNAQAHNAAIDRAMNDSLDAKKP